MSRSVPPSSGAADPQADTQAEAQRLAEAFRIFNQASEELSTAYTALQTQVAELTAELAAANGALRQQYLQNLALTERLALLLDALPAGVILIGESERVVQANPAAESILGRSLKERAWGELKSETMRPGSVPDEYRVGERVVAMTETPLDSAGGRIILLHDVTEAYALKTQAERNQRLASMGEMAAQLAHQLRTPLAAALLYAGNLELPELPTDSRISIAQKTVGRLKHLERLIQDMLLFARGEVLGREAFAVNDMVEELRHTFEPLARTHQIRLEVKSDCADIEMTGNRKALTGALTNLLENALDAVSAGGEVRFEAGAVDANSIEFVIADNGRGMAPATLARLFEPFFTTRSEGTGLGLAIARGVARAHGGGIEVSSTPGEGTRFVMRVQRAATTESE